MDHLTAVARCLSSAAVVLSSATVLACDGSAARTVPRGDLTPLIVSEPRDDPSSIVLRNHRKLMASLASRSVATDLVLPDFSVECGEENHDLLAACSSFRASLGVPVETLALDSTGVAFVDGILRQDRLNVYRTARYQIIIVAYSENRPILLSGWRHSSAGWLARSVTINPSRTVLGYIVERNQTWMRENQGTESTTR